MFISRQLKQFIAIAENISLTNAAEQLNLTPSALSPDESPNDFGKNH